MASLALTMEARLLGAALTRKRGTVALAVLAVAIGGSVASALLHVSGDVSHKLERELRALGPNLLVVPAGAASEPAATRSSAAKGPLVASPPAWEVGVTPFLDERAARARIAAAGLVAVPLLFVVAEVAGQPVQIIGTDIEGIRRLHPGWKVGAGPHASLMGARVMSRLAVREGESIAVAVRATEPVAATRSFRPLAPPPSGSERIVLAAGAALEAGGADDEAWWMPLAEAQAIAGLDGQASLFEARIEGGPQRARALGRRLDSSGPGGLRVLPIGALSSAEAELLARTKRLMILVTVAALVAAGLCAFGTLTDLALDRRREIALMKALGAGAREVARQFAAESLIIGLAGGIVGWLFGLLMAQVIGRNVFHATIAVRWDVPPLVLALSVAVAAVASLGPIRLALAIAPAVALKGD